ncbi:MAG: carbohydrate ABC transporter permease [Bifidobacteriaceae bacterium]|nr:carbohydrate ABC transporter permease [Bifidobacteriaceae bacterium]
MHRRRLGGGPARLKRPSRQVTEYRFARGKEWSALRRWRSRLIGLLAVLGVVFLFGAPLAVMIATSLTPPAEVGSQFWPDQPAWENYQAALTQAPMLRYFMNTMVLVVLNVSAIIVVCPVIAYSLSKLRWRGRGAVLLAVLTTMMLPSQVTLIPVYAMWDKLHLVGTIWPLVIPHFFGYPFYIYMLRQFFLGIPNAYVEAARVDGASEWRILFRIVIPMAKPAIITVALFQFVRTWTDFMAPLIYLQDNSKYTLSVGLYSFVQTHGTDWAPLMAACAMFTVPTFVLFLIGQRYFVEGATVGGLK